MRSTAGGTIAEMRVRDGDQVTAGEVILRLEDPVTRGGLDALGRTLDELAARLARLRAEQDNATAVVFPEGFSARVGEPDIARLLAGETNLFTIRTQSHMAEKEQLRQRISQLEREIGGYSVLMTAKDHELALVGEQLKGARDLRAKSLMPIATLMTIERDAVRLAGERSGQLVATAAQAEGRIAEMRLLIVQLDRDRLREVNRELRDTEARIADALERKLLVEDRARRLEVRAPQDGIVHVPMLRAVGQDVAAGDEVMAITPRADGVVVEAVIGSHEVGRIRLGQNAVIQLSSTNDKEGAKITGVLSQIAPEASRDRGSGSFYRARIEVAKADCARLGPVQPGMQAEVVLGAERRSLLSYFWDPLGERLASALGAI